MPTCAAKVKNKKCEKPAIKKSKYCEDHQGFEAPVRSKKDTGGGYGDTDDSNTGKKQAHNMQPKGSGNSRVGGGGHR